MASAEPKKWLGWLSLTEFWYNTSYHSSLNTTPFQALYGFPPPLISELSASAPSDLNAKDFLEAKQEMLMQLNTALAMAQARTKKYADTKQAEHAFELSDMAHLKLQPYRMAAFGLRGAIKLHSKFYGPF
jgi:hypothetical protein